MNVVTRHPEGPLRGVEVAGLVAALALAIALMIPLRGYVTDDTYIHLRYAQHLSRGEGLVFNAGERVYGCTSPLWVSLLADGMALGLDGLTVAKVLGALATLASVALFMQLMRRTLRHPPLRALATITWAGHAWMLRWSLSGMETPLAVALVLAGFVAFTEGVQWGSRPVRTGALWSLAALCRPEVVLLLGLWGIFLIADAENRAGIRRLVFGSLPPILIYGGWLVFARVYFGTFLPETLSAKAAGSQGEGFALDNLLRQLKILGSTDGAFALLLLAAMALGGRRVWPRRLTAQRMLPWVWVVAVPTLYVTRGVPVISRYLLPLQPVLAWLAWRAAELWWIPEPREPKPALRATLLAALFSGLVLIQNFAVYRTTVLPHVTSFSAGLRTSLVPWGRWFQLHTPRGTLIATPDIGAIGYFSDRPVLDLGGLVTPAMVPLLEQHPAEQVVADLEFASFARPQFLVDRADSSEELLHRSRYGACLVPIGSATIPGLGIARPGDAVYTFYRVDWAAYDTLRVRR
jgi:hypothetical protein